MPRTPLNIAPGLFSDDTAHKAAGRWADGSNVRFRLGAPEVVGGWEALTTSLLSGVCRWIIGWNTNDNRLHFAFGTHSHLQVWLDGEFLDVTPIFAKPARLLGVDPLATVNGSAVVTVTDPGHQLETGDSVLVSGALAVGGIAADGSFVVTVSDDSTYTYVYGGAASSDAVGGGSAVLVQPIGAFTAGQVDGTGQAGYGTGPYGAGGYATPSVEDYFPRTWSGGAFGSDLIASPRLGTIYKWLWEDGDAVAAPARNAPNNVTFCLISKRDFIFAVGCNEEISGEFNAMCVRHSSTGRDDQWNTSSASTAREYVLPGGGRLVAARNMGDYVLVWSTSELFLFSYVGQVTEVYRWELVGERCGLIGPGAAVVIGQRAFWISPDRQFWTYSLGGEPTPFPCPIREDFAENLSAAQVDKIVASSIGAYSEVRWDYPDSRDGAENSRYVAVPVDGPDAGAWYRGKMARTAFVDAGPAPNPLGVEPFFQRSPYPGDVEDDADCIAALSRIGRQNRFAKDDWEVQNTAASLDPVGLGSSGWGFRFSSGGQALLRVNTKTQVVGRPYAFSFVARTSGGPVTLQAGWRDASFNYIPGSETDYLFEVTGEEGRFAAENIVSTDPSVEDAQWCLFVGPGAIEPGVTVDVADLMMVEGGDAPAEWRPSPDEPDLFADYGNLIAGIAYDQHVGRIYWHERGQSADGAPLEWFIESADQYMSEDRALMARAFWPDAREQVGPVTLTLATRFKPRGEETAKTYVFSAEDEKVDVRATGRMFQLKLSGSAAPSAFRLGRAVIDMTPTGAR